MNKYFTLNTEQQKTIIALIMRQLINYLTKYCFNKFITNSKPKKACFTCKNLQKHKKIACNQLIYDF